VSKNRLKKRSNKNSLPCFNSAAQAKQMKKLRLSQTGKKFLDLPIVMALRWGMSSNSLIQPNEQQPQRQQDPTKTQIQNLSKLETQSGKSHKGILKGHDRQWEKESACILKKV